MEARPIKHAAATSRAIEEYGGQFTLLRSFEMTNDIHVLPLFCTDRSPQWGEGIPLLLEVSAASSPCTAFFSILSHQSTALGNINLLHHETPRTGTPRPASSQPIHAPSPTVYLRKGASAVSEPMETGLIILLAVLGGIAGICIMSMHHPRR